MALDSSLIFLGTGVSTGLPSLRCILNPSRNCPVCLDGWRATTSPNRRGNVAILLRDGVTGKNILVDCGKTMREAALRWLPEYGITEIDALLLTHGHFDAIGGMDDLRDFQDLKPVRDDTTGDLLAYRCTSPMPILLTAETMATCASAFPYLLVDSETRKSDVPRRVADLSWQVLDRDDIIQTIDILGLAVTCMPLWHGGRYISQGFAFGPEHQIVYLSDLHEVPPQSMEFLLSIRPRIRLLVVDTLGWVPTNSHFSLNQAVELIGQLRPVQARLVGMTCSLGMHHDVNEHLTKLIKGTKALEGVDIQLAHDGMRIMCNLHSHARSC